MTILTAVLLAALASSARAQEAPLAAAAQDARESVATFRQTFRRIQEREARARRKGDWQFLTKQDLEQGLHHARHFETFGRYAVGYNAWVLKAIDVVQKSAMDGGGYFADVHAVPAESPIGYPVALFGAPLLAPPRKTSFCTGASYTAFIEALNLMYEGHAPTLTPDRLDAMRMQEPDGGRREDGVEFWGHWNGSGYGADEALVQYSGMGKRIEPEEARAGDFLNIGWKNKHGHSAVFLGWYTAHGEKSMLIWSSQESSNGLGDYLIPLKRVQGVKIVRLTQPDALTTFDVGNEVEGGLKWDGVHWWPAAKARRRRRR